MASIRFPRRALLGLVLGSLSLLAHATPSEAEDQVIQKLIRRVESMSTMVFLRNGDEHNAADAAKHMRAKYDYFKKDIVTAEDFIARCASRSEMTGETYKVKLKDGVLRDANQFLNGELRTLRQGTPTKT